MRTREGGREVGENGNRVKINLKGKSRILKQGGGKTSSISSI